MTNSVSLPDKLREWADSNLRNAQYGPGMLRLAANEIERLNEALEMLRGSLRAHETDPETVVVVDIAMGGALILPNPARRAHETPAVPLNVTRYKVQQDQGRYCLKGCPDGDLVDWWAYEALLRQVGAVKTNETYTHTEVGMCLKHGEYRRTSGTGCPACEGLVEKAPPPSGVCNAPIDGETCIRAAGHEGAHDWFPF